MLQATTTVVHRKRDPYLAGENVLDPGDALLRCPEACWLYLVLEVEGAGHKVGEDPWKFCAKKAFVHAKNITGPSNRPYR